METLLLLLLLAALGGGFYVLRQRQEQARTDAARRSSLQERQRELEMLGLSDVRPRNAGEAAPARPATPSPARDTAPRDTAPRDTPAAARPEPTAAPETPARAPQCGRGKKKKGGRPAPPATAAPAPAPAPPPDRPTEPARTADAPRGADDVSAPRPVSRPRPSAEPSPLHLADDSPLWGAASAAAAGRLLESLWSTLGAQSVALLRADDEADEVAIEVLLSRAEDRRTAAFAAAGSPLLRLGAGRTPRLLTPEAHRALRYHGEPEVAVGQAAVVRVRAAEARGPVLLVADTTPRQPAFSERELALLADFGDLLGRLLDPDGLAHWDEPALTHDALTHDDPRDDGAPEAEMDDAFDGEMGDETLDGDAPFDDDALDAAAAGVEPTADEAPPRKRSDIIAEEMALARAEGRTLALALVVPQDAEAYADADEAAVADAEADLRDRLEAAPGTARVERFGELMAGAFCYLHPDDLEAWADAVQDAGAPLFVGIAVLGEHHADAEALRADAAHALHEAYETGARCIIVG